MARLAAAPTFLVLAAFTLLAPGCSPSVRDGWFACAGSAECPAGFSCQSGRCSRGTGTECRVDLHCDDADPCTLDVCEAGLCSHEPMSGDCDDGDFCNGPDLCAAGVCTNVGPAPCPGACDAFGCSECGRVGVACCDGFCAEGVCDGSDCVSCGATGEPCCFGEFPCSEPGATCDGTTCVVCGEAGEPCCAGGLCTAPLECDGTNCSTAAGCAGISCPSTQTCLGGECVACGLPSQPCCAGACEVGAACNPGSGLCEVRTCGGREQPCCMTSPGDCDPGLACATVGGRTTCVLCGTTEGDPCCGPFSGLPPCAGARVVCDDTLASPTCVSCGVADGRCCDTLGSECPLAGTVCVAGFCRSACGELGESCCALMRCGPGLMCRSGTCMLL